MKGRILLSCIFSLFIGFAQAATDYSADIQLLKKALETAHPGYDRYTTDIERDVLWHELKQLNNKGPSQLAFYAAVQKTLVALRCEHTKAELPKNLKEVKQHRFMPFRFRFFDNRMFVDVAAKETGLSKGDEIIQINNYPIRQIISQLTPYVERDGYTDHTVTNLMAQNFDLYGSSFEQFFSAVVMKQDHFIEEFDIDYKAADSSSVKSKTLTSIDFDAWISLSKRPYRLNFKDAVHLSVTDKTATLTVDTFVNYRQPIDGMKLFDTLFSELKNKGVTHLIVDLRNNGGGSDDAQMALLRHLYQQPFKLVNSAWLTQQPLGDLIKVLNSWDRTAIDIDKRQLSLGTYGRTIPPQALGLNAQTQTPAINAFTGKIILLTSKSNASASAALLAHIQKQPNVTLVGEETGGNQGGTTASIISFLALPESKIIVRIPLIRNQYNIKEALDGLGAIPDIYAPTKLDDWLSDRDVAMETAIALITQSL